MKIFKSYKFRIYPSNSQVERLGRWNDGLRFLWNLALEQWLLGYSRPKLERIYPSFFSQGKELTELRQNLPWLNDVPRHTFVQILEDLDKAWKRCFEKVSGRPRFKKKDQSFLSFNEFDHALFRIESNQIRFPKLGWFRAIVDQFPEGKMKSCTIKRDGDQWFCSVMSEIEIPDPKPINDSIVALDRGVVDAVADSEGHIIENPRFFAKSQDLLKRAQRNLSRKKKGSKNLEKAKIRVMRIHRKIRRQRENFCHQISHDYAKNHGTVVIEKLNIRNMTASASGTVENPGTRVRQKSGLNRSILDSGWGILADQLRYKLLWNGGKLIEVNPAYSSQTCSICEYVDSKSRISQSRFHCSACGHSENADVNAAKVLKCRASRSALLGEDPAPEAVRRTKKRIGNCKISLSNSGEI